MPLNLISTCYLIRQEEQFHVKLQRDIAANGIRGAPFGFKMGTNRCQTLASGHPQLRQADEAALGQHMNNCTNSLFPWNKLFPSCFTAFPLPLLPFLQILKEKKENKPTHLFRQTTGGTASPL